MRFFITERTPLRLAVGGLLASLFTAGVCLSSPGRGVNETSNSIPEWLEDFARTVDSFDPALIEAEQTIIRDGVTLVRTCYQYCRVGSVEMASKGCGAIKHPHAPGEGMGDRVGWWADGTDVVVTEGWLADDAFKVTPESDDAEFPYSEVYARLLSHDPVTSPTSHWIASLTPSQSISWGQFFRSSDVEIKDLGDRRFAVSLGDVPPSADEYKAGELEFDLKQDWPLVRFTAADGTVVRYEDHRDAGGFRYPALQTGSRGDVSSTIRVSILSDGEATDIRCPMNRPAIPEGMVVHDERSSDAAAMYRWRGGRLGERVTPGEVALIGLSRARPTSSETIAGRDPEPGWLIWGGNGLLVVILCGLVLLRTRFR